LKRDKPLHHAVIALAPVVLAVSVLGASAVWADPSEETPDGASAGAGYTLGRKAVEAKDWTKAVELLTKAEVQDDRNPDLENLLGYAYRHIGRFDEAFRHYEIALRLNPRHRGAHEYIGEAYLMVNNPAKAAGLRLWVRQGLRVPGGLLFTLAVWMTPLGIYGFERMTGMWPQQDPGAYRNYYEWVKGGWFFMEVGTIAAGLVALRFVRFPFLTFPVAFALWFMSMDLTPLLYRRSDFTWNQRLWVSLWFGLAFLAVSFLVDRRTRDDYAFWGYLFGTLAFWGGLSLM